jgi:hypothetical protein
MRLVDGGFENDLSITIRAKNPGLEIFYRQAAGTGNTTFDSAVVLSSTATLLQPMIRFGDEYRYWVHLGRQLVLGEETLVQIRETYTEHDRDVDNIHAYYANHSIEELELVLEYPASRVPTSARWREYLGDPETADVIDGGALTIDCNGGAVSFRRSHPVEGHSYSIEWTEASR